MPRRAPKFHPLNQSPLYSIQSRAKLAEFFGLTQTKLHEVLDNPISYSDRAIEILRNGKRKTRTIQEPRGHLRPIHEKIARTLSRVQPPDFLFCPVRGRSYVDNAARHNGMKEVRTLDVKEYFPSTPRRRVFWFFHKVMRCSPDVSSILAQLLTVNGHLATGSAASPILAFYSFFDMWMAINEIARGANCTLSVYMDDVTLSGTAVPDRVIWQVRRKLHGCGLRYHKEKRYSRGVMEVTGVLIKHGIPQVPNRQLKKAYDARQQLSVATDQTRSDELVAQLRGLAAQRRQVENAGKVR